MCRSFSLGFHMVFTWFLPKGRWQNRRPDQRQDALWSLELLRQHHHGPGARGLRQNVGHGHGIYGHGGHGKKRSWWKVMGCNYCLFGRWWWLEHLEHEWIMTFHSVGIINHPNWRTHIFQRGRYTTNQYPINVYIFNVTSQSPTIPWHMSLHSITFMRVNVGIVGVCSFWTPSYQAGMVFFPWPV